MNNPNYRTLRTIALCLVTAGLAAQLSGQAPATAPVTPTPIPEIGASADTAPDPKPAAPKRATRAVEADGQDLNGSVVPTPVSPAPPRFGGGGVGGGFGRASALPRVEVSGGGGYGGYGGGYGVVGGMGGVGGVGGTAPSFQGAPSAANPYTVFPGPGAVIGSRSGGSRDSVPPVVVEFSNPDPAALLKMEEDLAIMSRVLDQALERGLGQETPQSKMGVPLIFTSSGRSVRAMYIEGFGALFTVKVNMPLMAPPTPTETKPAEKPADSEWESARREVLGLDAREESVGGGGGGSETPFDPEQVSALKQALAEALKNAANIRGLKPEDYVSIAVFGQPMEPVGTMSISVSSARNAPGAIVLSDGDGRTVTGGAITVTSTADEESKTAPPRVGKPSRNKKTTGYNTATGNFTTSLRKYAEASAGSNLSQKGTVLTLRVKTSAITALAQGKVSLDEFTKTLAVNTYAGSGYGLTSVNSWILAPGAGGGGGGGTFGGGFSSGGFQRK